MLPRHVVLSPITSKPPASDTEVIGFPIHVKQVSGLDEAPSWVNGPEHNVEESPIGGLPPLPGQPTTFSYGLVPPVLFAQIKVQFLKSARARTSLAKRR